jgi:hypothetical protein
MARNTGAIQRVFDLFYHGLGYNPVTVTTKQINAAARGDGLRRYRELIVEGAVTEISRRIAPGTRQLEITARV